MRYFYDENNVRYNLVASNDGKAFNWVFFPGGPGGDSSYLLSLIEILQLPGNIWLIDMPGNGSHAVKKAGFDDWFNYVIPVIQSFDKPILVGHSFGGMFPLLFKELESLLTGFIIMNSAPCLWLEAAAEVAKQRNLPDLTKEMQAFNDNPSQATFNQAMAACMPYYFPAESIERGSALLTNIPFCYEAAVWWQHKAVELNFTAQWIPQQVKTLIISGEFDAIVPFSLFDNDIRFKRDNIKKVLVPNAGHASWVEAPETIAKLFENFYKDL